jgi:hypothetical protein
LMVVRQTIFVSAPSTPLKHNLLQSEYVRSRACCCPRAAISCSPVFLSYRRDDKGMSSLSRSAIPAKEPFVAG